MTREWYGWTGKRLFVNLTKEKIMKKPLTKELAFNYLGGRGLNIKVLWDSIKSRVDPLSPDNPLCIAVGPLNGTLVLSARYHVSCLSPYSGILGDGNAGGFWGAELKNAGYDQVILRGRATEPVYIWIEDDYVELRKAEHIWGKTTWETSKILEEEHGTDIKICGIGQAGENLVRTACTMSDYYRAAARGSGAVWGSKNVKAIVVRGTEGVKIAKPDEFEKLAKEDRDLMRKSEFHTSIFGIIGSPLILQQRYATKHYFQDAYQPEEVEKDGMSGEALFQNYVQQLYSCNNCPIHCGRYYNVKVGRFAGTRGSTCEFENLYCNGAECGNFNLASLLKVNNLMNEYGLDVISTGETIALAFYLYNKEIITRDDTDGLELKWGDEELQIGLIHKIAFREGFGNMLAEGGLNFAKIVGGEAEKHVIHVYGLSRPFTVPFDVIRGLNYITSTRGADHLRAAQPDQARPFLSLPISFYEARGINVPWRDVRSCILGQHESVLADCLTRCKRNYVPLGDLYGPHGEGRAMLLETCTGRDWSWQELDKVAERVYNLERAFNIRQGAGRKFEFPPWRYLNDPSTGGWGEVIHPEQVKKMLDKYYALRNWEIETGMPTRSKLEELGLKDVADELEANTPFKDWAGVSLWPLRKYPHG